MKATILLFIFVISLSSIVKAQPSREQTATGIIENFKKGDYEKVQSEFSGALKNQLTKDVLQQLWEKIIAQVGNYESVISTNEYEMQGYKIVKKRLKFAKDNLNLEITYNEDNKVIGMYFKP